MYKRLLNILWRDGNRILVLFLVCYYAILLHRQIFSHAYGNSLLIQIQLEYLSKTYRFLA